MRAVWGAKSGSVEALRVVDISRPGAKRELFMIWAVEFILVCAHARCTMAYSIVFGSVLTEVCVSTVVKTMYALNIKNKCPCTRRYI